MAYMPMGIQTDPMQELLGQALGGYKPGQLGAAPTLGNQEAQVDYARQLAEALAQQQQAESGLGMADRLSQAQYAPNSGALGSLAMVAQAYAGKKIRGKESKSQAEALVNAERAKTGIKNEESQAERSRRSMVAQKMGLTQREAVEFMETGKVPEAKRDRLQAIMSSQGLAIANLDKNSYTLPGQDTGAELPPNVRLDPNMSPEERAAAMADIAAGAPEGDQEYRVNKPQSGPLMPYKDPSVEQRQAAAEARANESMELARRSADRADESLKVQQQAAKNKPVTEDQSKSAGYALRMERALESITESAKVDPDANRPGFGTAVLDALPDVLGNKLKSGERQNIEAAQLDALDAALTLNTGAAYTKEQLFSLRKAYFPQPGDDESTIKAKDARLKGLIETARIRARNAYPGGSSAPAGNDDDLIRKYLPK